METIAIIIGFVGALAWFSPWVYEKLTKTDLEIKLISQYGSIGSVTTPDVNIKHGNLYLMKFAIVSKNKGFDYKNIRVGLKFSKLSKVIKGHVYIGRNNYFTLIEGNTPILKKLIINQEEELLYNCYMEKDKPLIGYLTFAIDTAIDEQYEELIIEFENFDNKSFMKKITKKDIKGSTLFFEDKIWKNVSKEELDSLQNNSTQQQQI